ncbi:asparagine synthase (glutamine-hydrolyzing) [Candidatus Dojkabacteria bacterium]|uniref:asparagine synthase (glutamine-hydrolyzing) n=1 Tax=Candidatus Dojkabacteria bacterium TaxID=2099670 RepID=A0A955IAM7_9BACT|nr:asparagine synthase (glutamine-hydrolyzing) [Candidatus Dojkabacteria bacterium]
MCGIVGFTGQTDSEVLKKMTDSITHRGPDDAAYIVNPNFSIGYRRLSIIDLSKSIYPITNEEDTIELVLNGEIYNYQELRTELEASGHKFKTQSDSETIVHGYEEWGYDVVTHLRGMFVFVLLDKEKNETFIARDRLGIKPWYYSEYNGRIVFGSEIKAILEHFDVPRDPDDRSVYRFLSYRVHDTDDRTFFKNVKRLLPGHFMVIQADGGMDIQKYWKPEYNKEFSSKKSDEEYKEEFKEIFSEAVRLHLIADVPVGVTLSGGLDSSGITSLSKQLYDEALTLAQASGEAAPKHEIIAFSAVHPGETIDESEYIDSVVEATGIKSVKIQPSVDTFWEDLDHWVYMQEEPVISGAPYAYYTVMREAAKQITVLLSGQGGDELLAGYVPYFMTYLQTAWDQKKLWPMLRETWMGKDLYFPYFWKLMQAKRQSETNLSIQNMLTDQFKQDYKDQGIDFKTSRNLNERLFFDVTRDTTPSLLRYEDKNSMANSLESRVPFFDHKVVEYIFNLPIDQKIKFGWNRFIYRNAMQGIIPDKNRLRRSKVGFTNPEWEWIERRADKFREIFSSDSFKNRPYWDSEKVLQDFEKAVSNQKTGDVLIFWRLFITEMWMRKYVD